MRYLSVKSASASILLLVGLVFPSVNRAASMDLPGWDLLATQPGTTFAGAAFRGVPLGTFDFGGGPQNVGNVDTIVHRLSSTSAPTQTTAIKLVALQLQSVSPIDLGAGLGIYYLTLQSRRSIAEGGSVNPSGGNMTITFDPLETFNSVFDVFFDVRFGGLNAPIIASASHHFANNGTSWSHEPLPLALLIDGVNHNLNGADMVNDFWPVGTIVCLETGSGGAVHNVAAASALTFTSITKISATQVQLEWVGAGNLESANEVIGPWAVVANASSPAKITSSGDAQFYRLKQ